MNEQVTMIAQRLASIMSEARAIGKDSKNAQQGFNFRGIDAVMNHLHPIFAKHEVFILPEVLADRTEERQTKSGGNLIYRVLTVQFHFTTSDGSSVQSTVIGEGMDTGDKAANKAMAVALKYALTQMLLLPYDEVDADATTPPVSTPKEKPPKKTKKEASEVQTTEVVLSEVRFKTGGTGNKPWTRFYTKADDGEYYSTFDKELGEKLTDLATIGDPVSLNYRIVVTAKGESRDVVDASPASPPDEIPMGDEKEPDGDQQRKGNKELPF